MNIMRFFGFDNDDDDYGDEIYTEDRKKKTSGRGLRSSSDTPGGRAGKLIVYNYNLATLQEDKIRLREELNRGAMILVDVHELNQRQYDEEGKDFITFMSGVAFARGGENTYIAPAQYIFTPGKGMCEIWPEEENGKDE